MSAPTTSQTPMLPDTYIDAQGRHLCHKRTLEGWVIVPAPWGADPYGWLWHQRRKLVYQGGCKEPSGLSKPSLQVWDVEGPNVTSTAPLLIGDLARVVGHPVSLWIFLIELPALPQLIAEYAPMLSCVCQYRRRTHAEIRADRKRLREQAKTHPERIFF